MPTKKELFIYGFVMFLGMLVWAALCHQELNVQRVLTAAVGAILATLLVWLLRKIWPRRTKE